MELVVASRHKKNKKKVVVSTLRVWTGEDVLGVARAWQLGFEKASGTTSEHGSPESAQSKHLPGSLAKCFRRHDALSSRESFVQRDAIDNALYK